MTDRSRDFRTDEALAHELDAADSLAGYRKRFHLPEGPDGTPAVYLCGHSLGLQPVDARAEIERELEDWARLGVDGHFRGRVPWFSYHEPLREATARLVGARPHEVVVMNGLSVNLHLMMVSFFRPTAERHKVLMEPCAFPSDTYAVQSQLRYHGFDPAEALLVAEPREGESRVRTEDLEALLDRRGHEIALVLLGGVNYFTGQAFDLPRIAAHARAAGCVVGYDLAHAAGNLILDLHGWDVDFAVWCSYKYLNSGPGATGACFVHERNTSRGDLPRFGGWWGNDPKRRFRMHLEESFEPVASADGWQLSNPPILATAPLRASMTIFDEAGMPALRAKSERLTAYLQSWVDHVAASGIETLTPRDPSARGCQLSLRVPRRSRELFEAFERSGVVGDYREPDVVRIAPVPLYNSFHDVWRAGQVLLAWAQQAGAGTTSPGDDR